MPFFKNLKREDLVSLPCFVLHSILLLVLIAWLDYAAFFHAFAVDWLVLQLDAIGGLNASLVHVGGALPALLPVEGSGAAPNSLAALAHDIVVGSDDVVVAEQYHFGERGERTLNYDAGAYELTQAALVQLDELVQLRRTVFVSYGACVAFFVLGCLANVALLSLYLRKPSYAEHFRSDAVWRQSMKSAAIGVGTLLNGGFINGLSQTAEGYRLAKRDSAAIHLLFHGIPCLAIASAVAAALDCRHRPCGVQLRGSDAALYVHMLIVVSTPIVWWQFARLVLQMVTTAEDDDEPPLEPQLRDRIEPPAPGRTTPQGRVALAGSLCFCMLKWLLQLLGMLTLYWNSPTYTGAGSLGSSSSYGWSMTPPEQFSLPFVVSEREYEAALAVFLLGMVFNLLAVSVHFVRYSSETLGRELRTHPGAAVLALTMAAIHPDFVITIADRRDDVYALRALGAVPALLNDAPLLAIFGLVYKQGRRDAGHNDPFLGALIAFTVLHLVLYLARALVVGITGSIRRPSGDEQRCCATYRRLSLGDSATVFVSFLHMMLLALLLAVYEEGWHRGALDGLSGEHADMLRDCLVTLALIGLLYLLLNLLLACSLLNHYSFSHEAVAARPFSSALVLLLSCVDVSCLTLLASDRDEVRLKAATSDVKRHAMVVSLLVLLAPVLALQVVVEFFLKLDWSGVDAAFARYTEGTPLSASGVVYAALGVTVIRAVWTLLLLVVLHVTKERDNPLPFKHTPLVLGPQWRLNRAPPEGMEPDEARPAYARRRGLGRSKAGKGGDRDRRDRDRDDRDRRGGRPDRARPRPAGGYDDEYDDEYGDDRARHQFDDTDTNASTDGPTPRAEMVEAICAKRALYRTPDGLEVVFIELPTADDIAPPQYLLVQVSNVRPVRGPRGRGGPQVSFTFNSVDVGGLDREFIEQSITTDPETAWRAVNGDGEPPPPDEALPPAPPLPPPGADVPMTPRTAAAQRL